MIVPAYTYTATASAAIHCGATVKFVDIQKDGDPITHMPEMDYDALEKAITPKTKAIIPVDLGGIVCDYKRLKSIVERKRELFTPISSDGTPLGDLSARIQKSIGRKGGQVMFNWKENGKTKLLIICGTRPEIIRLAAVMKRSRQYLDTCICYTNQNYDKNLSTVFWEDFELGGPDVLLHVAGKNLGETCANIISQTYDLMVELKPEAVLVLGDTNSCLSAINAKRLHMNALAIVSDSGTLPEESSFYLSIGSPIAAVCIRTSTERPEAIESGDFIIAGITEKELLQATDTSFLSLH